MYLKFFVNDLEVLVVSCSILQLKHNLIMPLEVMQVPLIQEATNELKEQTNKK